MGVKEADNSLKDGSTQYFAEKQNLETRLNKEANEIIVNIYRALASIFKDPEEKETKKFLNILCVRIAFCLYADSTGLFGKNDVFRNYLSQCDEKNMSKALIDFFGVLGTKKEERNTLPNEELGELPYIATGLFDDKNIEIPNFSKKARDEIVDQINRNFKWKNMTAMTFSTIFENTLSAETIRKGGMCFTTAKDIHKVLNSLFLDDLQKELEEKILGVQDYEILKANVEEFQKKISGLVFLDPACGSGNFLVETYTSLRRLENSALEKLNSAKKIGYAKNLAFLSIFEKAVGARENPKS